MTMFRSDTSAKSVEREKAAIGVFLTLEKPTRDMEKEAVEFGFYESAHFGKFPRLQILTVEDLFSEKRVKIPPSYLQTFKEAESEGFSHKDQNALAFE